MPTAKVNGININYRVQGRGEPLVLISGYSVTHTAWMFQTRAFKRYFHVITFDNRGVGKTDKPSGAYSTKMMADDTVGLMDYLGIKKAHILGIAMGGMIAQVLAINYPERINKLILASTHAGGDDVFTPEFLKALRTVDSYTEDAVRRIRKIANTLYPLSCNKRLYRIIGGLMMGIQVRFMDTKGLLGQMEASSGHNTLDSLHTITAPTLVITGGKDRIIKPSSSEVMAKLIPNAKLVRVEGGSHALNAEMSGRFNKEVLDFLRFG